MARESPEHPGFSGAEDSVDVKTGSLCVLSCMFRLRSQGFWVGDIETGNPACIVLPWRENLAEARPVALESWPLGGRWNGSLFRCVPPGAPPAQRAFKDSRGDRDGSVQADGSPERRQHYGTPQ
jgi:hypothetical protein